jgi:hypothetical protein
MRRSFLIGVGFLWLVAIPLAAQDLCPTIVSDALSLVSEVCSGVERNQACYGNLIVEIIPQAGVEELTFAAPGDIIAVDAIQTLSMSALADPSSWGVVLLSLQANLPDALPGQNVTMLLFGENDFTPQPVEDEPLNAFLLNTGIGTPACDEVPSDGVLIQTPEGAATVNLLLNGVEVELGSTALLRSQPDASMMLALLEGKAEVTVAGADPVTVEAGFKATIPTDEDGLGAGAPVVEPYTTDDIAALPLELLPLEIEVAAPATLEQILPQSGTWTSSTPALSLSCTFDGVSANVPMPANTTTIDITVGADGVITVADSISTLGMTATGANTYFTRTTMEGVTYSITMTVLSPTQMEALFVWEVGCVGEMPVTLEYNGE